VPPQPQPERTSPRAIVVMGVSGSGKSTLGALLAESLGCRFLEGDSFHSRASIAKMTAGQPLDDEDRWPWLDRLGAALDAEVEADGVGVAACSALKRAYRERLERAVSAPLAFVFLDVDGDELTRRLHARPHHYMPVSLLRSQLQTLERPGRDEAALALDALQPPQTLCDVTLAWLAKTARSRLTTMES
jgi:gluconokinase